MSMKQGRAIAALEKRLIVLEKMIAEMRVEGQRRPGRPSKSPEVPADGVKKSNISVN